MKSLVATILSLGLLLIVSPILAADSPGCTPFVGLWKGDLATSSGMLSVRVLVKAVDCEKGTATAVYSQGTMGPFRPYDAEAEGKFSDERTLKIKFDNSASVTNPTAIVIITMTLVLSEDRKDLKVWYEAPGRRYPGTLKKAEQMPKP